MLYLNSYNAPYVQLPPSSKPTAVGFFAPIGRQRVGAWSTLLPVRGVTRIPRPSLLTTGLLFNVRALPAAGRLEQTLESRRLAGALSAV